MTYSPDVYSESVKKRVSKGIKTFVSSQFGQSGSGKRKRRISLRFKKKKESRRDIFD